MHAHQQFDTETPETIPAEQWGDPFAEGAHQHIDETLRICERIAERSARRVNALAQQSGVRL